VLNYRKSPFWIIVSALVIVAVVSIGLITNPKKQEPILNEENHVSYGLMQFASGEAKFTISPLSGDNAQLAKDIIMDYMVKSAAWPGIDISTLEECYLLRATYSDGKTSDYYTFIYNGKAIMQHGTDGHYSFIDAGLYEKLVELVSSSTTAIGGMDGSKNVLFEWEYISFRNIFFNLASKNLSLLVSSYLIL
jgi:hypothetical protein